jgi:hypothetical protein
VLVVDFRGLFPDSSTGRASGCNKTGHESEVHAKVAAPDGNVRMKNRVNSGKPDSADADMVILSQASSHRVG